MKMKRIFLLIAAAALTTSVSAQQSGHDNHFGVSFGSGLNTMLYETVNGQQHIGAGFDAGIHYARFFNNWIGLGVGAQYSYANATALYDWSEETPGLTHAHNPNALYTLYTDFDEFRERQNLGSIGIPVEVMFRKLFNDDFSVIFGVGLQLDLPIHGRYIARSGSYTTYGVVPGLGAYPLTDMPEHGFSTYTTTHDAKIKNRAKAGGSVIADLGVRIPLNQNWGLYCGLYAGYGFTNIIKEERAEGLVMTNATDPSVIDYRGTFDSNETKKANLLRCGLKLAIDFGWSGKKASETEQNTIYVPVAATETEADREARQAIIREEAEKAVREALAREKAEAERLAAEKAVREKAEAERLAREKAAAEDAARRQMEREEALNHTLKIYYKVSSTEVVDEDEAQFQKMVRIMNENQDLILHVKGYASVDGDPVFNNRISEQRAIALKKKFVDAGIDESRITTEHGLWPNSDRKEGRSADCRFTIAK